MRRFRKRTIALVIASVVTVVGAFGADNYKNCLMGLSFEGSASNNIKLELQTKLPYENAITPMRKNANTYMIILPEVNSTASVPDLKPVSSDIASVSISQMPYSNTAKGYTRIVIKTNNQTASITTSNKVYVATSKEESRYIPETKTAIEHMPQTEPPIQPQTDVLSKNLHSEENVQSPRDKVVEKPAPNSLKEKRRATVNVEPTEQPKRSSIGVDNSNNLYFLWATLIVLLSAFFYVKAKNKLHDIAGEQLQIEITEDDSNKSKKTKFRKITNAIKVLDAEYSNTSIVQKNFEITNSKQGTNKIQPIDSDDIIDLDELFNEHKNKDNSSAEEENQALEDFLSGFSFDDEIEDEYEEEKTLYDIETYDKVINSKNISFSQQDISCVNELLSTEINDDTKHNLDKYISHAIKANSTISKQNVLESIVTNYAIKQDIIFAKEDIDTLYKLMNIELDNDFITDLHTNPQLTSQMTKDIMDYDGAKTKKASEVIVMSVKDMLPDLSEALKHRANREIESNYKPETIYYSEGYDVAKLSITDVLPDLSVEINKQTPQTPIIQEKIQYSDSKYSIGSKRIKISSELPDLQDALAHPEKYEQQTEVKTPVDEEQLLESISNVRFVPFAKDDDKEKNLNVSQEDVLSVEELQNEFKQFDSFEISPNEQDDANLVMSNSSDEYDDFEELYSKNCLDLDKKNGNKSNTSFNEESVNITQKNVSQTPKITAPELEVNRSLNNKEQVIKRSEKNRISAQNNANKKNIQKNIQSDHKTLKLKDSAKVNTSVSAIQTKEELIKCILDGETYVIVSSVNLGEQKGCYLAKNNYGYSILTYVGNNMKKIKQYDSLKSEKIHARVSEKTGEDLAKYIIRVGTTKFMISVTNDNIEYLMEL